MPVRVYYSTDSSAPVYSGSAGALIALLNACLVDGYGAKAAAGWTREYFGTNLAVFRPSAGNRHYLRVDDSDATAARVRGYEAMSDVSTGTGLFPTDAQINGGGYCAKSSAANADARGWVLVADEKRFWLLSATSASTLAASTAAGLGMFFGDIFSGKAGDAFHTLLITGTSATTGANYTGTLATSFTQTSGHYLPRSYTQTGESVNVGKHGDHIKGAGSTFVGGGGSAYPDPITGGILLSPVSIHEPSPVSLVRGVLPGAWQPLHSLPGAPGDTFQGSGTLAGKSFLLVDVGSGGSRARMALEISDTWG